MTKDIEYFVNLNLKGNEIKDVVVEQVDTLPTTEAVKGRIVYLTTPADSYAAGFYYHNGTGWKLIVDSTVTKTLSDKIATIEGTIGSSGSLGADVAELKEIVKGAGGEDTGLVGSVNKNASEITTIKTRVGMDDTSGLSKRIATNETNISGLTTSIGTDSTPDSVKGRIKVLEGEMGTAQEDISKLKETVGDSGKGLVNKVATLETKVGSAAAEGTEASGLFKAVADNAAAIAKKVDKVDGKGLSTNDYTTTEKEKLAGIAEGAQVNVLESVKVKTAADGDYSALAITDKAVSLDLSGYALKTQIPAAINWKGSVANEAALPPSGNTIGDMYHVDDTAAEYIWNGSKWEYVGQIVDLDPYSTTVQMNAAISSAVSTAKTELEGKIALKANDKDLKTVAKTGSYNDLTDKPVVDAALSSTSENAVQNKAIYSALAGKVDKLSSKPRAGDYAKVTINEEGQVTAGLALAVSDLPTEIPSANILNFTTSVRDAVRKEGTLTFGDSETEKTFDHGLNCTRPHVTVYSGTQIVYTGVEAVNENTIKISGNKLGTVTVVVSV